MYTTGNFSPLPESPELVQFLAIDEDPVDELLLMSYTPTVCTAKEKEAKIKKIKKTPRKNLLLFIDRSFIAPVRSYVAIILGTVAISRGHGAHDGSPTVKHTVAADTVADCARY